MWSHSGSSGACTSNGTPRGCCRCSTAARSRRGPSAGRRCGPLGRWFACGAQSGPSLSRGHNGRNMLRPVCAIPAPLIPQIPLSLAWRRARRVPAREGLKRLAADTADDAVATGSLGGHGSPHEIGSISVQRQIVQREAICIRSLCSGIIEAALDTATKLPHVGGLTLQRGKDLRLDG